jgi:hypothetical protein
MPIAIACSARFNTPRSNIGDILSAQGIAFLEGFSRPDYCWLPERVGESSRLFTVYGGGWMLRPLFSKREVFQDFMARESDYSIRWVWINFDLHAPDLLAEDIVAMKNWIEGAVSVTVRDHDSREFVGKFTNKNVGIEPCPSYFLVQNEAIPKKYLRKIMPYGIVPSFGHTKTYEAFEKEIIAFCKNFVDRHEQVRFICHDLEDFFRARCIFPNTPWVEICCPRSAQEVAKAYGECSGIISMRAHGIIFSAAMQIPVSVFPFSNKIGALYRFHYQQDQTIGLTFDPIVHEQVIATSLKKERRNESILLTF